MDDPMNEELNFGHFTSIPRQHSLLRKYCAGVEDRIKIADSKSDASKLVDNICQKFDAECESDVLRSGLRAYLSQLLHKYWNEHDDSERHTD